MLENQLDVLADDLESTAERTRDHAAEDIRAILRWLLPPSGPVSAQSKKQRIAEILRDDDPEALERIGRVFRSTGRPRGRPKTDTAQHAIDVFHYISEHSSPGARSL